VAPSAGYFFRLCLAEPAHHIPTLKKATPTNTYYPPKNAIKPKGFAPQLQSGIMHLM